MIADQDHKYLHVAADHHRTTDMIVVVAGAVLAGVLMSGPRPLSARELAARRCSGSPRTSTPAMPHVGLPVVETRQAQIAGAAG